MAMAVVFFCTLTARAGNLPSGYEAASGNSSYSVSPDGTTGTLTARDTATVGNWNQGFNVGAGHTFNAFLPADGVHLSRDVTANPSEIFGSLNVPQGKFFLVNTSGIFFGPGSSVNAAGLVASSLDISDQDFLSGNYRFVQGAFPASVVNAGEMTIGGNGLALLGGAVQNSGLIAARESSVVMAGGREMTLSFDPSGLISVLVDKGVAERVVDKNGAVVTDGVLNTGMIRADGGKVLLTAQATNTIFNKLVNQKGLVEAGAAVNRNGVVELVAGGEVETGGMISASDLVIGGGTVVNATDTHFLIGRDWVNGGDFNGESSTVEFVGGGNFHHVYGSNLFYDLEASGADRTILFEAGKLQTIEGALTLQGDYARLLKIHSTAEGEKYFIDVRGDYALDFVDVRDSGQIGSQEILITRSHSDGNIFGWNADPDWNGNGGDNN
ncbi:MAG: filamentous hemagglutinin N-terminal domain-containing protein, partial [Methylocella sp.]